jgi:hypothetical protein
MKPIRREFIPNTAWVLATIGLLIGLFGCGSTSPIASTPPGTYTVTITATVNGVSHTIDVPVTVQ